MIWTAISYSAIKEYNKKGFPDQSDGKPFFESESYLIISKAFIISIASSAVAFSLHSTVNK